MSSDIVVHSPQDVFSRNAFEACMLLSASPHTRRAYWHDVRKWIAFCREKRIDPALAPAIVVAAWIEAMKRDKLAPKTRNRRLSACASIYDHMRRTRKLEARRAADLEANPFSAAEGPKREAAHVLKPTPLAEQAIVATAQALCDRGTNYEDVRDAAILRVLWATGARRSSVVQITRERLAAHKKADAFQADVPGKGGKTVRIWFAGRTAAAVRKLLSTLTTLGMTTGAIFRMSTGRPMAERDVWRAVKRRGKAAGGVLTPHSFRVAFLTLNPASLEARQDAATHADPATTRKYDRKWRGREAFEAMPDVEDAEGLDGDA